MICFVLSWFKEGNDMTDMKKLDLKTLGVDLLVDIIASICIAAGVHNFALYADLPMSGFTGIALILYHLISLPIGIGILLLNIPVAIFCYKYLGKVFFYKSIKTVIISSIFIDHIAPLFPAYEGDRLLAAACMGVLCGTGYALVFMRGSSTGGQDFISMAIRRANPHITLGSITLVVDTSVILLSSLIIFREIDGFIYGVIATYLMATVMDRILYGMNDGKMSLIITGDGDKVARLIDDTTERGSTILKGRGYYSGEQKDIVLCACNTKEMYTIGKAIKKEDPQAFTIIMESNEVVGEGFKESMREY